MTKKEIMIEAHKMVKEIKREYPEVDYKFQLGLCLTYLYENKEEVEINLVDKIYDLAKEAVEDLGADDFTWNKWEKHGHNRIYISLLWYGKGKIKQEVKCGYIDINKNEYVGFNQYSRVYDLIEKIKK